MLDKITGMRVFVATVQQGSFVAAAEKLAMSPQMVARHIASMEKQLETRLLTRTTRQQSLTPTGNQYFKRCQTILQAIADADSEARGSADVPSGTLRLNAPVTFGRYALTDFLTDFLARYPHINIELTLSDDVINPAAEDFDAVIRIGELDKNLRLAARPLAAYRLITCAAPEYLAKQGWPQHPADLAHHQCLTFAPWQAGLSDRWPFISEGLLYDVDVNSRLKINDWGALLEAAIRGAGVVMGYDKALALPLKRGQLVAILADYPCPERAMHLLWQPARVNETRYRVFIDALCEYFH
ncbi:LysR family transcriptional regulator [Pantoea phytobeneficialis]|uniref:LysR family transcriptional regulator n=1 Tax=Pantoea phytobeneficialis TaxID=2052056 RepID=A0AAP9H9R2_9GAMM|nr:LysR family transcriptional regulator [Pantoea phytobeneficialis]MDO6406760.1 LysR family transcriptional regulator [Pantoea phytobeneficialis]QGR09288.1 LysR family transcriptional regulator [Pantoea phytobeneficialis]